MPLLGVVMTVGGNPLEVCVKPLSTPIVIDSPGFRMIGGVRLLPSSKPAEPVPNEYAPTLRNSAGPPLTLTLIPGKPEVWVELSFPPKYVKTKP